MDYYSEIINIITPFTGSIATTTYDIELVIFLHQTYHHNKFHTTPMHTRINILTSTFVEGKKKLDNSNEGRREYIAFAQSLIEYIKSLTLMELFKFVIIGKSIDHPEFRLACEFVYEALKIEMSAGYPESLRTHDDLIRTINDLKEENKVLKENNKKLKAALAIFT